MSQSNLERLKAAGVLKKEHVEQLGKKEKAKLENLSNEDVDHIIRIKKKMSAAGEDAAPIACYY